MASGNESYNVGLSNGISDLLESVAKASTDPYSVISAEDLLARVTRYNNNLSTDPESESLTPPDTELASHPRSPQSSLISTVTTDGRKSSPPTEEGRSKKYNTDESTIKAQRLGRNRQISTAPTDRSRALSLPTLERMSEKSNTDGNTRLSPSLEGNHQNSTVTEKKRRSSSSPPSRRNQGEPSAPLIPSLDKQHQIGTVPKMGSRVPTLPQQTEESKKSNTPQMSLVGSDVVALFPSITAERSGRIVREEIQRSEIKFEGLDKDRALAYVAINKDKIVDYEKIVPLLP